MPGEVRGAVRQKAFAAGLSQSKDWHEAALDVLVQIKGQLPSQTCDVAVLFVSEGFTEGDPKALVDQIYRGLGCRVLIGCNASGIVGMSREVEMEPAISLLAMQLPEVTLTPFTLAPEEIDGFRDGADLIASLDIYPPDKPSFIICGDPATADIQRLLALFNEAYEGQPVVGGMASGGAVDQPSWLALNGEIVSRGVVGLALSGPVKIETIVAQGCRPIGTPLVITKAENHKLLELGGKPVLEVLSHVFKQLSAEDQVLARHALFVGLVMNEQQSSFKRGDFLIRNIVGVDPKSPALLVGAHLRVGQMLQFQLRDAKTSHEDFKLALTRLGADPVGPRGALLFSCCGRGSGLYGEPDHDIKLIQSLQGQLPLTGFFANGELGPVAGKNFIHGYTASLAIIR